MDESELEGLSASAAEAMADAGGSIPVGKYHAKLAGTVEKIAGDACGTELIFEVVHGPFAGAEVKGMLWKGESDASKGRRAMFGHRLGLLGKQGDRYHRIEGKEGFEDCLGAEVVIEVKHEADKKDANKKWPRLGFQIWMLDDPKVKDVPKAAKAAAKGVGGASAPVNKSKKVDTSEL